PLAPGYALCAAVRHCLDRRSLCRPVAGEGRGMSGVRQQVVARDEDGVRLDRWFATHFPQVSFGHLQKMIRTGQVRVDKGRVKTSSRLAAGQVVRIPPVDDAPDRPHVPPAISKDAEFLRALILYED